MLRSSMRILRSSVEVAVVLLSNFYVKSVDVPSSPTEIILSYVRFECKVSSLRRHGSLIAETRRVSKYNGTYRRRCCTWTAQLPFLPLT